VTHAEDLCVVFNFENFFGDVVVTCHGHRCEFTRLGLRRHHNFMSLDTPVLLCNTNHVSWLHKVSYLFARLVLPLLDGVEWVHHNSSWDVD